MQKVIRGTLPKYRTMIGFIVDKNNKLKVYRSSKFLHLPKSRLYVEINSVWYRLDDTDAEKVKYWR